MNRAVLAVSIAALALAYGLMPAGAAALDTAALGEQAGVPDADPGVDSESPVVLAGVSGRITTVEAFSIPRGERLRRCGCSSKALVAM